jgi:hypothetical protein
VEWAEYRKQRAKAELLNDWLRKQWLSLAFVYRVLAFDEERRRAELVAGEDGQRVDLKAASWRARWAYQLARNVRDNKERIPEEADRRRVEGELNELLGLQRDLRPGSQSPGAARIALSIAIYRNRVPEKRQGR